MKINYKVCCNELESKTPVNIYGSTCSSISYNLILSAVSGINEYEYSNEQYHQLPETIKVLLDFPNWTNDRHLEISHKRPRKQKLEHKLFIGVFIITGHGILIKEKCQVHVRHGDRCCEARDKQTGQMIFYEFLYSINHCCTYWKLTSVA